MEKQPISMITFYFYAKFLIFVFDVGVGEGLKKRDGEFMTKCNWNI